MSAWRGLTRPEQHRVTSIPDMAYCVVCGDDAVDLLKGYQYSTPLAAVEDWQDARGDAIDGRSLTEAIFAVQRVRELHHSKLDRHPQGDVQRCIACLDLWPCSTIRAIEGVPNE